MFLDGVILQVFLQVFLNYMNYRIFISRIIIELFIIFIAVTIKRLNYGLIIPAEILALFENKDTHLAFQISLAG